MKNECIDNNLECFQRKKNIGKILGLEIILLLGMALSGCNYDFSRPIKTGLKQDYPYFPIECRYCHYIYQEPNRGPLKGGIR